MKKLFLIIIIGLIGQLGMGTEVWLYTPAKLIRTSKPTHIKIGDIVVYDQSHSEEDLNAAGYYTVEAPDCDPADYVIDWEAHTIREMTEQERQDRQEAQRVEKTDFIKATELQYKTLLTSLDFEGAWNSMDYTYEQIGLSLVQQGKYVEVLFLDKLYNILLDYYKEYGGSDLRLYPWESDYIYE